jgi:hypothetical protein
VGIIDREAVGKSLFAGKALHQATVGPPGGYPARKHENTETPE